MKINLINSVKNLSKKELCLWIFSILVVTATVFLGSSLFEIIAGLVGVSSLIFAAKGDVITYEKERDGSIITHRVVEISKEDGTVTTKGDANEVNDMEPVRFDQVLGRVEKKIPGAGRYAVVLSTIGGKLLLVALLLAGYLLSIAGSNISRK